MQTHEARTRTSPSVTGGVRKLCGAYVFGKTQRAAPAPMDMNADGGGAGIDALPGDIFVSVLRRLRAHSLARCRCVCTLWRALVDGRGLLLPHALPPRSFPGFFASVVRGGARPWSRPHPGPGFLAPPASRAPAVDRLAFLRPHLPCSGADAAVQDQCNGLVLCFQDYLVGRPPVAGFVCNPTTERWARLPPPPTWWPRGHEGLFLAFDPAVSLEYEVLLLPVPPPRRCSSDAGEAPNRQGQVTLGMFMPESFEERQQQPGQEKALPLLVFSSAHGRWTRRLLAPGRCAPAGLYDRVMRRRRRTAEGDPWVRTWRSALYRRGSLYAHCEKRILVVLHCSEGTYDMVKLPADDGEPHAAEHVSSGLPADSILVSAEDRVLLRYASVDVFRVKVWALQESSAADGGAGQLEWTLTHDKDLAAHARMLDLLHHAPSNRVPPATGGGRGKSVWFSDEDAEEVGNYDVGDGCSGQWNWDDASLLDIEIGEDEALDVVAGGAQNRFSILGCHPSKEVIFLVAGAFHVVAYHLTGGKVQYLGRMVTLGDGDRVEAAIPYRPCTVDALPSYTCPFPSLEAANKTRRLDRSGC